MGTPYGTSLLIRYLNPVPNLLGLKKLWSEQKCSLGKALVGHGGGGGQIVKPVPGAWQSQATTHTCTHDQRNKQAQVDSLRAATSSTQSNSKKLSTPTTTDKQNNGGSKLHGVRLPFRPVQQNSSASGETTWSHGGSVTFLQSSGVAMTDTGTRSGAERCVSDFQTL